MQSSHRRRNLPLNLHGSERPRTRAPPPPESPSEASEEEDEPTPAPRGRPPRERTPILVNVDELEFTVSCAAFFDEKKVWFDANSCRLSTFKVHDFNAKVIKAVDTEAERMKTGSELASCVATIGGAKLKQLHKTLEDPSDWGDVERIIERHMREGVKSLHVDYVVHYCKK